MADPVKWKQVSQRMRAVDELSYRRISDVIDEYGYPTREMVGVDGEKAAFLLVQHQAAHLEFMQFVLDIMAPLAKRGEVDSENFALLTDRVLVMAHTSHSAAVRNSMAWAAARWKCSRSKTLSISMNVEPKSDCRRSRCTGVCWSGRIMSP